MITRTLERQDGERVEVWLPDVVEDAAIINDKLDLQLLGIKLFHRALERSGKIWFGGEA
jgi:hypothetical protein